MSKKKKEVVEQTQEQPIAPNLCYLVQLHLENIGYIQGANVFKTHPMITDVWDANPQIQRVILNRYFSLALLVFRGTTDIVVHNILRFLIQDGTYDDWFSLFCQYVSPFLKEHGILEKTNI